MDPNNSIDAIIAQILVISREVDSLYEVLPRDDYYRMKQLMTEAEKVMKGRKSRF